MKTQTLISIIATILVFTLVILVGILTLDKIEIENAYIQCCNGSVCSDTYYTYEDNLCHLSLCESSAFTDKKDCVYPGANISMNMSDEVAYHE